METIQFKADQKEEDQFAKELAKKVRMYFKDKGITAQGDYRMILKAIVMIGIYLAPITLIITVDMPAWMAIILLVIMGIGEAGIGMAVMHDAVHGSFSKYNWVNKLMGNTMFLLGSNVINWKLQHNLFHHTYTNLYGWDGDIESKGLLRLAKKAEQKKVYRYQYLFGPLLYGLMTLSKFFGDFGQLRNFQKRGALEVYGINYNRSMLFLVITKIIYLGVFFALPILFTDFTWWQILLGFFIMHFTASVIMGTVFQMAHVVEEVEQPQPDETGVIHHNHQVHMLHTTSDFYKKGKFLSWYIGGLDYQVEHHLFPHVSHLYYPDLAVIVKETAAKYNLPHHSHSSFMDALKSHLVMLKKLGRQ